MVLAKIPTFVFRSSWPQFARKSGKRLMHTQTNCSNLPVHAQGLLIVPLGGFPVVHTRTHMYVGTLLCKSV